MSISGSQLTWSVDGREAGSGMDVEVLNLKPGNHTAKVVARDGSVTSTREVKFSIYEQITATALDPTMPGVHLRWPLYIMLTAIIIVIAWLVARRVRRHLT